MSASISDPLLALIKEQGMIDDLQLDEVIRENTKSGKKPISQILVESAILDLDSQLNVIAEYLGTEVVTDIMDREITEEVIHSIPPSTARMYQCIPIEAHDHAVQIALVDPMNPNTIDEISFIVGREIHVVVADPKSVEDLIEKHYYTETESFDDILMEFGGSEDDLVREIESMDEDDDDALESMANDTPIVRFVNLVMFQAINDRASDIHFEPFEDEYKIRYRVDGALYEMAPA